MSIKNVNNKNLTLSNKNLSVSTDNSGWIRSQYWLSLPDISNEDAIILLVRIEDNNSNHIAFRCQGAYTVDWGDENTDNYNSNTNALHTYNYSSISDTNESELGYRQVIIKITPQAGQSLTVFNGEITPITGSIYATHKLLEAVINCPSMNSLRFGGNKRSSYLESVIISSINNINITNLSNTFSGCVALQNIVMPAYFPKVTSIASMFNGCASLTKIPNFSTGIISGTGAQAAFGGCRNITSVPRIDYSNCTSLYQLFSACGRLGTIPPMGDTSNVTNFQQTFNACTNLKEVPDIDTSSGTGFLYTFLGCSQLTEINIDTSSATDLRGTFQNCFSLRKVPNFSISGITQGPSFLTNPFYLCNSLQELPPLNFANTTSAGSLITNGLDLQKLEIQNAENLTSLPSNFLKTMRSLSRFIAPGLAVSINLSNCYFSSEALDEIYTNLASGVVGQTITVTGNYGVSGDDPTIATNKGWTVVG
jgi:hypothetical protein